MNLILTGLIWGLALTEIICRSTKWSMKFFLAVTLSTALLGTNVLAEADAKMTLYRLKSELRARESLIHSIAGTFVVERNQYGESMDNVLERKFKISFALQGVKGRYDKESQTEIEKRAFDGKVTRTYWRTPERQWGFVQPIRRLTYMNDFCLLDFSHWLNKRPLSAYLWSKEERFRKLDSQIAEEDGWVGADLLSYPIIRCKLLGKQKWKGRSCWLLSLKGAHEKFTEIRVWIDPFRGYISPRKQFLDDYGRLCAELEATDIQKVGPELWMAWGGRYKEYTYHEKSNEGVLAAEASIRVTRLEVNKRLPDDLFRLSFPVGTRVYDEIADVVYRSGYPIEKSEHDIVVEVLSHARAGSEGR